jgi:HSP20 family protein
MDRNRTREGRSLVPFSDAGQMLGNAWSPARAWFARDDLASMNMYETEEGVVVELSLPGVDASDLEINVMGDTLSIRGELKRPAPENVTYLIQERSYGEFQRTIQLPGIMSDNVDATLEKGLLRLELSKPESDRPRKIQVKAIK